MGDERRMYEAPHVVGIEKWPLSDVLSAASWSMPDLNRYLDQEGEI
jgi:hypothetical protein